MRATRFFGIILALSCAACSAGEPERADPPAPNATDRIAVTGALIIDGLGGEPIPDGVVLIEGERIAAVGPADAVVIPDDALTIDADACPCSHHPSHPPGARACRPRPTC